MTHRSLIALGAFLLFAATVLGAYGAHGMRAALSAEDWSAYQSAVQYHFFHGLGVILIGLAAKSYPGSRLIPLSGWLLLAGIVLFSGSIYATSFGAPDGIGVLAPVGGMSFMLGWVLLGVGVIRAR